MESRKGEKMQILRLYLGEITSLVLLLVFFFVAAAVASRYFPNRRTIRIVRNLCIAVTVGAFATSFIASVTVNQIPRGRIDRSGADQDQRAFEQKHSEAK
jgi:hypothetical protein